jgi:hypothetical protein
VENVLMSPRQPSSSSTKELATPRRRYFEFAFAFACVFAGLALPSPGLGPLYVRVHTAIGNAFVERARLSSGVALRFEAGPLQLAEHPWQTTLIVEPPAPAQPVLMPIELRTLMFLPTVAFIALALAVPLGSPRKNLRLLLLGLPLLELLLLVLMALPVASFLGGMGPIRAFSLGAPLHAVLQILYRALVAPPGMAYALPLLLWWVLVARLRARPTAADAPANAVA